MDNHRGMVTTMNELQKLAEMLIKCGYAEFYKQSANLLGWIDPTIDNCYEVLEPFANTFEGYKQLDAIETYILDTPEYWDLWNAIEDKIERINSIHNHKIAIIKEFIKAVG